MTHFFSVTVTDCSEFLSEWQVLAVAARDLKHAQEFAQKHSIPRSYGSYEELAKDPEIGETVYWSQNSITLPPSVLLSAAQKILRFHH